MNRAKVSLVAWSALALGACSGSSDTGDPAAVTATPVGSDPASTVNTAETTTSSPMASGGVPSSGDSSSIAVPAATPAGPSGNGGSGDGLPVPSGGTTSGSGGEASGGTAPTDPNPGFPAGGGGTGPGIGDAGSGAGGTPDGASGASGAPGAAGGGGDQGGERLEGVSENFSFFVTSYFQLSELAGNEDGFGGNLTYNGASGVEGADAICQEMANRVGFNNRTWKAYLSTSTVDAKDRVGTGPWYDFVGNLVAEDVAGLIVQKAEGGGMGGGGLMGGGCTAEDTDFDRPLGGALDCGTYDELGLLHDGTTDQNNDGMNDDDHDTMTATLADGTYSGFSCDDWTSTTAMPEEGAEEEAGGQMGGGFGGVMGGIMMGHSWPAGSGTHWTESHGGHYCAAGTNFVQNGGGDSATVGGGGGYGGFYCFALAE